MMNKIIISTLALTLLAAPALIAKEGGQKDRGPKRGGDFHKEMMAKFDKDGDGKLSEDERAEAKAAHEARREEMKARHEEMKKKFDADGDGKLSPEERKAAFEAQLASGDLPPHMMKRIDTDGDGTVSDAEREAVRAQHEERRARMEERRAQIMDKCDKDGDGELSEEERKACKELMRRDRGGDREGKPGRRRGGDRPDRPDVD